MDTAIATGIAALLGSAPGLIAVAKYVEHLYHKRQAEMRVLMSRLVTQALATALHPIEEKLGDVHNLLIAHENELADVSDDIHAIREWIKADPGKRPLEEPRRRDRYSRPPPSRRHRDLRARASTLQSDGR